MNFFINSVLLMFLRHLLKFEKKQQWQKSSSFSFMIYRLSFKVSLNWWKLYSATCEVPGKRNFPKCCFQKIFFLSTTYCFQCLDVSKFLGQYWLFTFWDSWVKVIKKNSIISRLLYLLFLVFTQPNATIVTLYISCAVLMQPKATSNAPILALKCSP